MASLGVDVSTCVMSQGTNNFNYEVQIGSQQNEINAQSCPSQQEATVFSHAGNNVPGYQDLYTQMNLQLPNVIGLEDQTSTPYPNSSRSERLFEEMNQGIYESYLGMDNGSNIY